MTVQIQLKTTISCLQQNCTIISFSMSVVVIYIVYSGFWLALLSVDVGIKLAEPR
jgi:hypothetical protein